LLEKLKSKHWIIREDAVKALTELGDKRAVESIIKLLKDEHIGVKRFAINALGIIGDKRAIEPLQQTLEKETESVILNNIGSALRKLRYE